jgi:L-asparaginase
MITRPKILLIYTGGTIGMIKDFETGALKAFNFDQLLERIPELNLLDCTIDTYSFDDPIDSSDMNPEHWVTIAEVVEKNFQDFDGFVVLHGSDTMSYTASALSFMLKNLNKPVILTGSQLPIGDLRTDAKENLITAIQIAAMQDKGFPVIKEVGLYFEYKLYRGNRTTKISAEHFNAFTSPNLPHLAESGVHLKVNEHLLDDFYTSSMLEVCKELDTNVFILKIFPGITQKVLEAILNIPHLKGIVLETFGSGNAPTEFWFINTLQQAIQRGVKIVNVTQCWGGSVDMGKYETGTALKQIGVISGHDITSEAAITKMMILLPQNLSMNEFSKAFQTPFCGELIQE